MKMYEKMKNIGKKALIGAALVGSLYSPVKADLPVTEDTRAKIEYQVEQENSEARGSMNSRLEKITGEFNEFIGDREFSVAEQDSLYKQLDEVANTAKEYGIEMPEDQKELYGLLNENLNGVDYGTPSLETELREDGVDVSVEGYDSKKEWAFAFFTVPIILAIGLSPLVGNVRRKVKGENENENV
jgi:hypothetical protein